MDPHTISLIISLISGLVGGNIAGSALSEKSLGGVGNSVTGIVGGGIGSYVLKALGLLGAAAASTTTGAPPAETAATAGHAFDFTTLLTNIGGSGVGGAVLTAIVAFIKDALQKKWSCDFQLIRLFYSFWVSSLA